MSSYISLSLSMTQRRQRKRQRKEEIAVVAVHQRLFARPFPDGYEEELQHLLVFQILKVEMGLRGRSVFFFGKPVCPLRNPSPLGLMKSTLKDLSCRAKFRPRMQSSLHVEGFNFGQPGQVDVNLDEVYGLCSGMCNPTQPT
ncbi:unnamed protein product [Ilex paraguariensis]|uniref:Uncharacterized protein n=1 Tax=Ilex paraguariensis TaxID=185542 RepID=A0ABC8U9M9_9AQUA